MIRILIFLALFVASASAEKPHAVIICGTYHYSPQKTMPPFAAELERLGFRTTVISPNWDPEKDKRGLPGLEALETADVALFFVRFLKLEDAQLTHITKYLESGKPVVGFRTSTHAFKYPKGSPNFDLNHSFGRDALGTPYQIHLKGSTQIKFAPEANSHPILAGVPEGEWTSPGTLYLTKLQPGIKPLLIGTGKSGGNKTTTKSNGFGTHKIDPVMTDTVAWTWKNKWGGRTFTTSLGHVGDFAVPQSMRVMVNGLFWAAGQDVPDAKTEIKTFGGKPTKTPVTKPAAPAKKERRKKAPAKPTPKTTLEKTTLKAEGLTLFYGNSFVERLQEDGTLEALLHAADPDQKLQFRSLAYTGDEVGFRIRPAKFGDHLGYITSQLPCDRVVLCFGMNESFAGADGLPKFEKDLALFLGIIKERHPGSELILVSPTAVEDLPTGDFPKAATRNTNIALYCAALREAATTQGARYINLLNVTQNAYHQIDTPLTENGLHLNQVGNRAIARGLACQLGSKEKVTSIDQSTPGFESLRKLVSRKAYEAAMAYKPANGIHYYGLRSRPFEYAEEIPHHFKLAQQLDEAIWLQAKDLSKANPFPTLTTTQAKPPARKPRKGLGTIVSSKDDLANFTVADGFEVNLFASSEDYPELINPLQIQFDARGRLWVSCYASYPVPVPGSLANDTILIFEDTDNDGKADKRTVFADGLKLPDGFVFYKDGIIVSVARQLVWLRDTDGDSIADARQEWLRGRDDTDTHHGGYLARAPQGHIIVNEALFHRGQFETPHGPVRTKNAATLYLDPVSKKLTIERQTTHPNPWKISYNTFGDSLQMFGGGQIIDCDYYNIHTPVGVSSSSDMGMPFRDDKGCTLTFVSGSHFPSEWQGGLLTGHLLGKNAVLYTPLKLEGGTFVKAATSENLISSNNKVFRPVDLEFGLDGALYISDFYYPIIGHAQHSIRDANRDYSNGRIWRVTKKGAPLSKKPKIERADLPQLFALLTHPQVNVRQLARYELERRPNPEVLAYARTQIPKATQNEQLGLELLWLFERLHDPAGKDLFLQLAKSQNPAIRQSATRSLRTWASSIDKPFELAQTLATKGDRTKLSLISTASYLQPSDPAWGDLIQNIDAPKSSPLDKMKTLAALHSAPALSPEFPLLKVSDDSKLSGWIAKDQSLAGTLYLKSSKDQSVVLGYQGNPFMNIDVNGIPLLRATGSQHSKDGQLSVDLKTGINKIAYFSEIAGKPKKGKTSLYLANLVGNRPDATTFAKDLPEHQSWSKAYEAEFATVTDTRIYLKAIPSQLAFNVTTFTVKAGTTYDFVFENPDHMLHNIVITQPGKATEVGELSEKMASAPDAMKRHFIPESDAILLATPQIPHGGKAEQKFTTPAKPGKYPYICTFPGHWRIMKGTMIVK